MNKYFVMALIMVVITFIAGYMAGVGGELYFIKQYTELKQEKTILEDKLKASLLQIEALRSALNPKNEYSINFDVNKLSRATNKEIGELILIDWQAWRMYTQWGKNKTH